MIARDIHDDSAMISSWLRYLNICTVTARKIEYGATNMGHVENGTVTARPVEDGTQVM